jgi:hypothetical protein
MKVPEKTQRQVVLEILEERGDRGCHSFEFIQARIPRVAARVCELRAEEHSIDSEPEALHGAAKGVRYTLTNVGEGASAGRERPGQSESDLGPSGTLSGVADAGLPSRPGPASPPANPYDCWVEEAA